MHALINLAINAQGGLDQWRKFNTVSAHLVVGGVLWEQKGHGGVIDEVDVKVNLLEQKTSHIPGPAWHTAYTPDRIAIETGNGDVVEEFYNPRSSYAGHAWETPGSNLQLAYFTGYATWNYFNTPFQFTRPGFEFLEIEPWEENSQTWHALKDWTDGEVYRAITAGVSRSGEALFPVMPYHNFGQLDDRDVHALIAYLRSIPAVRNDVPASRADFPVNLIIRTIPPRATRNAVRPNGMYWPTANT